MFVLASDFDRTFYINNVDLKKNILSVNKFMENNIFIIATGRSYDDFMNLTKGSVKQNYLLVNYGSTIIKDDKVIKNIYIKPDVIKRLKEVIDFNNVNYFACSDKNSRVSIDEANINKINITFPDNLVAKRASDYLKEHFKNDINVYTMAHKNQIEIIDSSVNKYNSIKYLIDSFDIPKTSVYSVGDGLSDLMMIKNFNGFAINGCCDEILNVTNKKVSSVSEIIDFLDVTFEYINDYQFIVDFINRNFGFKHYFEKYMSKIYGADKDITNLHIAIKKNDEIIGIALLKENTLSVLDKQISVLSVGSVCILEKYRNKGYFNLLMGYIDSVSKKYDISMLSGSFKKYAKYGYHANLLNIYTIDKSDKLYTFDKNCDSKALDIYNNQNIHLKRHNMSDYFNQWKSIGYSIYQDNIFMGYLIYNTRHNYIDEICVYDKERIPDIVSSFASFMNANYMNVRALHSDYELNNILSKYNNSKMYNRSLFKINNIIDVIKVYLEYKSQYQSLEKGILRLKYDQNIIVIDTLADIKVYYDNESNHYDLELEKEQFMDILLNKKISSHKLLNSYFYLDIDVFTNDLV